jgi:hypothetical protein
LVTIGSWAAGGAVDAPLSVTLAFAAGFLLVAVSVPVSLSGPDVGAYRTVTLHDFFGPRLVAVHPSAVFVNAVEPDSATVNIPVAVPPELVNVNVWDAVFPACTIPKLKLPLADGDHASTGTEPVVAGCATVGATSTSAATARPIPVRTSCPIALPSGPVVPPQPHRWIITRAMPYFNDRCRGHGTEPASRVSSSQPPTSPRPSTGCMKQVRARTRAALDFHRYPAKGLSAEIWLRPEFAASRTPLSLHEQNAPTGSPA